MDSSGTPHYIVAGCRAWNRAIFDAELARLPGQWDFAADGETLKRLLERDIQPRYVFFLHWSDRVPDEVLCKFECVCFHMTDVPYGRGGSPLQNLIVRGHKETQLTALRMVHEMDAGPVYMKMPLDLSGSAQEIFERASVVSAEIIKRMIKECPQPVEQSGEVVPFKRRKPAESEVPPSLPDIEHLHDHIRMLDAEGYPLAFIEHGGFRFEFRRSALAGDHLQADVKVTRLPTAEE